MLATAKSDRSYRMNGPHAFVDTQREPGVGTRISADGSNADAQTGKIRSAPNALGVVQSLLRTWREHVRQRQELRGLSARDLQDMGLTRADAQQEISKPFWRT